MNRIVLDNDLRRKLHNLTEALELCDEDGRVLAYLTPVVEKSLYDEVQSPLSEEELQRRIQEPGGRPLAEILKDLEQTG